VEALAQNSKQGFVFLFDRSNGKPIFPLDCREYPSSNVPGEVASMLRDATAGAQAADASPRALATAILELAQQPPDALRAMGDAGRDWVGSEHGRPVLAQRLDAALRQLVAT